MPDVNWSLLLAVATATLSGAVVTLRLVAPMTANETDNKVLSWLEKLEALLVKVVVPGKDRKP